MTGSFSTESPEPPRLDLRGAGWVIGQNVPWSVSWTAEQGYDIQLSTDFPGLIELVQSERQGEGTPRFAALHITRHRAGMAKHLCHVCGQPTPKRDRYIFPKDSGGFVIMPDESRRYAGNVPPVHLACARRAQSLCPHLRNAFATPVAFPAEPSRLIERTSVVPGMEPVARSLPPNLKIVYTCYRLYGPRFTAQVAKLRQNQLTALS